MYTRHISGQIKHIFTLAVFGCTSIS